jgi:putative membrane protein
MKQRKLSDFIVIFLKGIAMGAADIVPGISGGTIAFITGIYEELLEAISAVNFNTIKLIKSEGIGTAWKSIHGNFLLALISGIALSIITLAQLISWLLENQPILLWSFFFGLVLASIIYIGRQISKWGGITVILFILGGILAFYITMLNPLVSENSSSMFLFLSGAIAICAMILPGISGSFILVLLGAYKPILDAIHEKDIQLLIIVITGAIFGLMLFSRILNWLFKHYKNYTLAILSGFILGSLNKIWPWKEALTWRLNSEGVEVPFNEQSISPFYYVGDPQIVLAILLSLMGFAIIFLLEFTAKKSK